MHGPSREEEITVEPLLAGEDPPQYEHAGEIGEKDDVVSGLHGVRTNALLDLLQFDGP